MLLKLIFKATGLWQIAKCNVSHIFLPKHDNVFSFLAISETEELKLKFAEKIGEKIWRHFHKRNQILSSRKSIYELSHKFFNDLSLEY